jgi:hypothetical protein
MEDNLEALEEYKTLITAVINYSITSYIKMQHPLNRKRKPEQEDFLLTLDIFYDPDYRFEHFINLDTEESMSTLDMFSFAIGGAPASMKKAQDHIVQQSIDYWWEKNFHDISFPTEITLAGKVWRLVHSPKNHYIDWDNFRIYSQIKGRSSDRLILKALLQILLKESSLNISEEEFLNFHKMFYLFLKVNNAFPKL